MSSKPNILFILADQQRYDCIGKSNRYPVKTPNIDALAAEGVWFSNAFSPIPVCCPARQSMLRGKRAESFGALWNYKNGLQVSALEPTDYTWVKDLQKHGYSTGHIGKWSIHPHHNPDQYGFTNDIKESEYSAFRKKTYPNVAFHNGFLGEIDPVPLEDARTHWMAKKAVSMIKEYSLEDTPWLLSMDFPEPHLPCRPSGKFAEMYDPKDIPEWGSFPDTFMNKPYIQKQQLVSWNIENYTWEDWAPIVARYYGTISQVDDAIGIVLCALDQLGLKEDTIVIYSADHGDMCGGHRMLDKHYVLYDDNTHIPLVIRWPGKIAKGHDCSEFVCHSLDIPPTILECIDIELQDDFTGRSLLPLMKGEKVSDWRKEVVSTYNGQQFGLYTQRMIRDKNWKYIWNTTDVDELYNLEQDPNELVNVIHRIENYGLIQSYRQKLYEVLVREGDDLVIGNDWLKNQLLNGKKI